MSELPRTRELATHREFRCHCPSLLTADWPSLLSVGPLRYVERSSVMDLDARIYNAVIIPQHQRGCDRALSECLVVVAL